MARYIVPILLFFLPFVLFAVYLWLTNRNPADSSHWTTRGLVSLGAAGLVIAVVMFVLAGSYSGLQLSGRNDEAQQTITPRR
jgi:hypothetical protein